MLQSKNKIGVVILSAGKGTRLGCTDIPKVMLPIGGKPIVSYAVATLKKMGFEKSHICLVVGFYKEKVMEYFGEEVSYAVQEQQKGTAHAAYTGMVTLPSTVEHVLVMGGDDSAFYTGETLENLLQRHIESQSVLSLLTTRVEHPEQLGRVVHHSNGNFEILEKEQINEEQKSINEVSTGTFVFQRKWFESIFPTMPPVPNLGEYGLSLVPLMAKEQKQKYQTVLLDQAEEWFGINTPAELEEANRRKQ